MLDKALIPHDQAALATSFGGVQNVSHRYDHWLETSVHVAARANFVSTPLVDARGAELRGTTFALDRVVDHKCTD